MIDAIRMLLERFMDYLRWGFPWARLRDAFYSVALGCILFSSAVIGAAVISGIVYLAQHGRPLLASSLLLAFLSGIAGMYLVAARSADL